MCRVTIATRASSPTRPGSAAFPRRPTQYAEKTVLRAGQGGGIECLMTTSQAKARTTTEKRLRRTATATHSHSTSLKARSTTPGSGPRQTTRTTSPAIGAMMSARRAARLVGTRRNRLKPPP